MQELARGWKRVLAVGAHPDDAEFFAGGTLAALAERGATVVLAVCTDGARGGRGLTAAVEQRRREQRAAAAILGVAEVVDLGFADGELEAGAELREHLVREIRRGTPQLVLGHDPRTLWRAGTERVDLGHSDHRAAGSALLDSVYPRAASPNFYPELGPAPWCPQEIWLFDTERPDLLVDVSGPWERKLEALRAHASQEGVAGGLVRPATEMAREVGGGERLAEGFVRLRIW